MTIKAFKNTAIALAACGMAAGSPAAALDFGGSSEDGRHATAAPAGDSWQHSRDRGRDRGWERRGYRDDRYYNSSYRGDRVRRDTRVWRGGDGRYYCKKDDGTTGLLIGAAVGGLVGNEVAGRRDKTIGTLLGAVGGALLGREIDRGDTRCR